MERHRNNKCLLEMQLRQPFDLLSLILFLGGGYESGREMSMGDNGRDEGHVQPMRGMYSERASEGR